MDVRSQVMRFVEDEVRQASRLGQHQAAADGGFTLLEGLVAFIIMSLALAVLLQGGAACGAAHVNGRNELQLLANIRNAAIVEAQADGLAFGAIVQLMRDTPAERGVEDTKQVASASADHPTRRSSVVGI